ncbi:hypothetical protein [Deinococcus koreensis]|uniref:Uncharacterized protein n=1 Tax=Deinococcus koreensis TaxID=2054903 RepID=A0A2K3UZI7_9DEIO|nr:hypothetical protein [Deinococcus koreensis]PNY81932.1 hypothetical protein CVO96_11635 [Deinococcus koreensis]
MIAGWRLLARSPVPWGLLALLLLFSVNGGTTARTVNDAVEGLNEQLAWIGLWAALLAALLASRDRAPGLGDVVGSSPVSRGRYVVGQALALLPLIGVAVVVAGVAVWWPHKPELTTFLPPRLLLSLLPSLAGAVVLAWLGLAVGHALKGPLVFVAPVLLALLISAWSRALPHTLGFAPEARCSELVGCPPLPYALHAGYLLGVAVLLLLLAVRASRWLPLHSPANHTRLSWGVGLGVGVLVALSITPLAQAAQRYPRWDWTTTPPWPAVSYERPDLPVARVPSAAYACTSGAPRVCLPHPSAELGQRLQGALRTLHQLQPSLTLPAVTTYPDLNFASPGSRLLGGTLYLSERKLRDAVPSRVTEQITLGGKTTKRITVLPDDLMFLQGVALHVLRGTPVSGPQPRRSADGTVTLREDTPDAAGIVQKYVAWLSLRGDPRWNVVGPMLTDQQSRIFWNSPGLSALWQRGEQIGHDKLARALLGAVQSGRLRGPAKQARTFAQEVK